MSSASRTAYFCPSLDFNFRVKKSRDETVIWQKQRTKERGRKKKDKTISATYRARCRNEGGCRRGVDSAGVLIADRKTPAAGEGGRARDGKMGKGG